VRYTESAIAATAVIERNSRKLDESILLQFLTADGFRINRIGLSREVIERLVVRGGDAFYCAQPRFAK
jgi:hypothetical protein